MADRPPHSGDHKAAETPPKGAGSRLDFYLPPPDDRAFRRGKIQRLRDQITAWRHSPRGGNQTVRPDAKMGGGVAAKSLVWGSAGASSTLRGASHHEKRLILSNVSCSPHQTQSDLLGVRKRGQQTSPRPPSSPKNRMMSATKNMRTIGRVTEVPYFHDYVLFCLPKDEHSTSRVRTAAPSGFSSSVAADEDYGQSRRRGVNLCCGVTSNREEMAQHAECFNLSIGLRDGDAESAPVGSAAEGQKVFFPIFSSTQSGNMRTGMEAAAPPGHRMNSMFLARAQSVELATAVHAECTRCQRTIDQQQTGIDRQRTFSQTMEVPIDWTEFERLKTANTLSRFSSPFQARDNSLAGTGPALALKKVGVGGYRGPVRLYTIRARRNLTNLDGFIGKVGSRYGARVFLPESWKEGQ